jgi:hypothetical protein
MAGVQTTVEARLEALERECRMLRGGLGAVLLAGAAVVLMGQSPTPRPERNVIAAQHFIVHDETGQNRAVLGMNANGGVGLTLMGQTQVRIGVNLDSAGITLLDGNGKMRLSLGMRADGSEGVTLLDPDQKPRIAMNLLADQTPQFILRGLDGQIRASLTQTGGSAGLLLMDTAGKVRGALAQDAQATALDFMDKAGTTRLHSGVKEDGTALLTLFDERGTILERHPAR